MRSIEGNTSATDCRVSPCNAFAMDGSSAADMRRFWTEVNERKSWSHIVGSISSCWIPEEGLGPGCKMLSDSTLERKDRIRLYICAAEMIGQSNLSQLIHHWHIVSKKNKIQMP